jgi:O-antigen/teichoic acid export membrane protein
MAPTPAARDGHKTMKTPARKLALGAAAMAALTFAQRGAGLIVMAALARVLDPSGLGAYAFVYATSTSAQSMTRIGVDAGLHITLAEGVNDRAMASAVIGQAFTAALAGPLAIAGLLVLFADLVATEMFHAPQLKLYVFAAAALLVGQSLAQFFYVVFAGLNNFAQFARISALGAGVTGAFAITGGLVYGGLGAALGGVAGQAVLVTGLAFKLDKILKAHGLAFTPAFPTRQILPLIQLGLPFSLGVMVVAPADFFALGWLSKTVGVAAMADQRVIQAIMALAIMLPSALAGPMGTYLTARRAEGDMGESPLLQLRLIWGLAVVSSIGLCSVFPWLTTLLFGAAYADAGAIGALAIGAFVPTMTLMVLQSALLAHRHSQALVWIGLCMAVVLAGLAWLLIPRFQLAGFLLAQASAAMVSAGLAYWRLQHVVRMSAPTAWRAALLSVTAMVWAFIVFCAWAAPPWPTRLTLGAAGLLIAVWVLWRFAFTAEERARLIAFAGQMLSIASHRIRSLSAGPPSA